MTDTIYYEKFPTYNEDEATTVRRVKDRIKFLQTQGEESVEDTMLYGEMLKLLESKNYALSALSQNRPTKEVGETESTDSKIHLRLGFHVPVGLVDIYRQATSCEGLGYPEPLSEEQAKQNLIRYSQTHSYRGRQRLGILKIYKDFNLVGFAFPRLLVRGEGEIYKIENENLHNFIRMGFVYILPEYRKQGIFKATIRLFAKHHPNMVWVCTTKNQIAIEAAQKAGFEYIHRVSLARSKRQADAGIITEEPRATHAVLVRKEVNGVLMRSTISESSR